VGDLEVRFKGIITAPLVLGVILNFLIAVVLVYYSFLGGAGLPRSASLGPVLTFM
jgi:hypothetical protein